MHPCCSRDIRSQAAIVLRRFRDGEITNDEFEDFYYPLCRQSEDRALRAIATLVWGTYSDMREHTLPSLTEEVSALFDRSILFLQADLPYQWERDNFLGIAGVSGLIRSVSRIVKRLLGKQGIAPGLRFGPETPADWSIWPFANDRDLRSVEDKLGDSASGLAH